MADNDESPKREKEGFSMGSPPSSAILLFEMLIAFLVIAAIIFPWGSCSRIYAKRAVGNHQQKLERQAAPVQKTLPR